jgi:hypothetical protein
LFFVDLGKKIGCEPQLTGYHYDFLVNYFKTNNSLLGHNLRQRLFVLFF